MVDADQLARDVVRPSSSGLAELVREYGSDLLLPDGSLDRRRLARLVFEDPEARRRLNAILHPLIARRAAREVGLAAARGERLVVYEAALLVEEGIHQHLDGLIVVTAPDRLRLARVMKRDGLSEEEVLSRMASQLDQEEKEKVADFVIENGGSFQELEQRTLDLLDTLGSEGRPGGGSCS